MSDYTRAAGNAAKAIVAALEQRPLDAVRYAVETALDLVTPAEARRMLTDAAVRRQNAIADEAERAKFALPQLFDDDDEVTQ